MTTNVSKLIERIKDFKFEDIVVDYGDPFSLAEIPILEKRKVSTSARIDFRLPSRLNSPLISVPQSIVNYLNSGFPEEFRGIEQNTLSYLSKIGKIVSNLNSEFNLPVSKHYTDMESFLETMNLISSSISVAKGSELESLQFIANSYADLMIELDLKQATMRDELLSQKLVLPTPPPGLLTLIMRVRAIMTRSLERAKKEKVIHDDPALSSQMRMDPEGWTLISSLNQKKDWIIVLADRWAMVYHANLKNWVIVPMTYMDYFFTKTEILYNLEILSSTDDYSDIKELVDLLVSLSKLTFYHDKVVDFMKSFEGLINMTADLKADQRCSIGSIVDVYGSMEKNDRSICGISIELTDYLKVALSESDASFSDFKPSMKNSILFRLAKAIRGMTPVRMLEVSSLHKFCFYAVIDETMGFKKFCKRTHKIRDYDPNGIDLMRCYFNREYIIGFTEKHKRLPTILSDESKLQECDVIPGLKTTDVSSVNSKYSELIMELKKFNKISKVNHPLDWWHNLRPYNCEEDLTTGTPIEHAKDKRSAIAKGTYSMMDSEKELEKIIRSEKIDYIDIISMVKTDGKLKSTSIIQQGSRSYSDPLTTVLKEKEREQKKEGRLFGMFTTEGKQSLSRMMSRAEHVLSYFNGNLMTPPDSKRKEILHWMAQSLLDDDKYALLADIEGHNQSMQSGNTGDLLESIGLIYGEFGWWKLSRLFSNLNLFYACVFEDYAFLSTGQEGGIEGWMNPVWTMHTLIVTALIPELTPIELNSKAVYSDDIAIVITLSHLDDATLNITLKMIQDHFFRFGMILKSLQTVVSKLRITMLRQHYIAGIRADSSLKRMISASTMGNQFFHSDEIESAGLVSAISSSLELSNCIFPQIVLKWKRLTQLLIRPFISALLTEIDPKIMNSDYFKEGTVSHYRSWFPYERNGDSSWIVSRLVDSMKNLDKSELIDWLNYQRKEMAIKPLHSSQSESASSQLIRLVREDAGFFPLFVARCILPVDMGGVNSMVLEQMILTGVRDNVSRTLGIFINLFKPGTKNRAVTNQILTNVLGGNGRFGKETLDSYDNDVDYIREVGRDSSELFSVSYDESLLANQEWPNALRQTTPNELIKGKLLGLFKKICNNKELTELLSFDESRRSFKSLLIDELKDNFYGKIARFYMDVSGYMIVDKILSKVENTSSLIKRVNRFPNLCLKLAECAIKGPRKWLLRPVYNFGIIDEETNIQEYLFNRRNLMFPKVKFVEIIEPEVNSTIEYVDDRMKPDSMNDWTMQCTTTSGLIHKGGKSRYLPPLYGNEALYKGSIRDEKEMFVSLKEALVVKCVSVSKWIIFRSDDKEYFKNVVASTNISNCADLALGTLGYARFRNYQAHVPLLTRSEIAHRIPVLDQNPKSVLRCLPSQTTKYKVTFNQNWVYSRNLTDSNIHFDYYKMRIICAESVSSSLNEPIHWSKFYRIKVNFLIRDVQLNFVKFSKEIDLKNLKKVTNRPRDVLALVKIRWLAEILPSLINGEPIIAMPKIPIGDEPSYSSINLSTQLIMEYYHSIRSQNLWDFNPMWSSNAWLPFISRYKELCKDELELTPESIQEIIMSESLKMLKSLRETHSLKELNHVNKIIIDRVSEELNESDEEVISTCDSIIELLNVLSMNAKSIDQKVVDGKLILSVYHEKKKKLIRELFFRVVIEHCLIVNVRNGELSVDRFSSELVLDQMLMDLAAFMNGNDSKVVMASIILEYLTVEDMRFMAISLLDDSERIVNNGSLEFEIDEKSIVKIKFDELGKIDWKEAQIPTSVMTRFFSINNLSSGPIVNIGKMIQYRALNVNSRGNPEVYESPLCSDMHVTAYSLLKYSIDVGLIIPDTPILDLTAGRGEFNIAANQLGLRIISVNRKDQYCAIKSCESVSYYDDYDWTSEVVPDQYYTLVAGINRVDSVVLFDLSHLGKNSERFVDRLMDILPNHSRFIVRFKVVSKFLLRIMESEVGRLFNYFVSFSGDSSRQCPHSYLILVKKLDNLLLLPTGDDAMKISRRVIQDIRSVISYARLQVKSPILKQCSVFEDFNLVSGGERELLDLLQVSVNREDSRVKMELSSYLPLAFNYYVPEMVLEHLSLNDQERYMDMSHGQIFNLDHLKNFGYSDVIRRSTQWKKCRERPGGIVLQLTSMSLDDQKYLREKHPVKLLRKVAHLLVRTDLNESRKDIVAISGELTQNENVRSLWTSQWGIRSRNFHDALLLLAGNSLHNDCNLHLKVLNLNYKMNLIKKNQYFELLKYCNFMSGMQKSMDRIFGSWANQSLIGTDVMENYYDTYIRKLKYSKGKKNVIYYQRMDSSAPEDNSKKNDDELARLFLETADKAIDFDLLCTDLISDSNSSIVNDEGTIGDFDFGEMMGAGTLGNLGEILSSLKIEDSIIRQEESDMENLKKTIIRGDGESEEQYESKLRMMILMASMNDADEYYDDDD